jgi:transposase
MDKSKLSDEEWVKLAAVLKKTPGIRMGCETTCRCFVEAVLWILRAGAQWRLLPDRFGHWNSVFKRFARWSRFEVWEKMLAHVSTKADLENVCIDSTVVRAHACAAGAAASNATAEALGRSRGGFGCKVHALTDALGLPVRFILTGGQAADITQAIPLIKDIGSTGTLLADKGYDANALLDWLEQHEIVAVIPPKAKRKEQRSCDWHLYKERHVIECMFGKLKYFRRVATRYEKKASHFMEMLAFAAVLLWLR